MKILKIKLFLFTSLAIFSISSYGQTIDTSNIGKIPISVVMPEATGELNIAQLSRLKDKVIQVLASSGICGNGYSYNCEFAIYPKLSIYDTRIVEGGVQNINVVTGELSLGIQQISNKIVFASYNNTIKGTGYSKVEAIDNLISQVSMNDKQIALFLKSGTSKIMKYYDDKCQEIINKSGLLASTKDYENAVALLLSVPEQAKCYDLIMKKATGVYLSYKEAFCKNQLQKAKGAFAEENYSESLSYLTNIDPDTSCFKESQELLGKIEKEVRQEDKKIWDLYMEQCKNHQLLEKNRFMAIKEMALEYYRSHPN